MPLEWLAQVLRSLPEIENPDVLVGIETSDDAAVYRLQDGTGLVQTVDYFPPLVDDPFVYGQVVAANAVSDVYAMGGRPLTALNLLSFPENEAPPEMIAQILRGGAEKAQEADMVIVGGHTLRDREIKYGLAVTGVVDPARVVTNAAARVGDALVLTKALGTGILATAIKADALPPALLKPLYDSMTRLNRWACQAMMTTEVRAATDVTGYGLIGHGFQMASGSGVTLRIHASAVPLLPEVLTLAEQGLLAGVGGANRAYLAERVQIHPDVNEDTQDVLFDPQTSGGLLIAVAPEKLDELVTRLHEAGDTVACRIGEVIPKQRAAIIVEV